MSPEQAATPPMADVQNLEAQIQIGPPNVGEPNVGDEAEAPNVNPAPMNIETDSTQATNDNAIPSTEAVMGLRRQTSVVWNHFKRQKINGEWKAVCNYCGRKLLGEPSQGTSHLTNHFKCCKLRTTRDIRQAFQVPPNVGEPNVGDEAEAPNVNPAPMNIETDSTQATNDNAIPSTEAVMGLRSQTSVVWNHFKRQKINGELKAVCNYCGRKLLGEPSQGTSHLTNHFKCCKLRTTRDIRQAFIKTEKIGGETVVVGNYAFNQETTRRALARMIILHEYPMSIVDHMGFKDFCATLQPLFKGISRNTVKSDIMKSYKEAKENTMKLLSKNQSRIAITTDMWTASHQNKGYMTVTAHFVDDSWTLRSRLVRFIYVPAPNTSKVLADVLLQCLMDWNLDRKVSTLTVDNCTTNDAMIERILGKILPKSLILGGKLFHMRCCAHILNLIVKDGLSIISGAIEKVRDSVSFWTATPKREEKFVETCGQVNIPFGKKLVLDCKTRWNSTFLMLRVAIQYKDVFDRLSQRENQYKSLPSEDDWKMANEICEKLELFYDVTLLFSGTMYPTSNVLFPKICEIKLALLDWLGCPNLIIHQMASNMITKFDKYWGVINGLMAICIVLDPRYKVDLLDYFFPQIYGENSDKEIERVKAACQDLVREYDMKFKGKDLISSSSSPNSNVEASNSDVCVGKKEAWKSDFAKYKSSRKNVTSNLKSEFDRYLEEDTLPDSNEEFDILAWWKSNGLKYPTMQMIARDFLAIPISTVASESSFSTSGRFVAPHRSKLRPSTLEALICVQDWLWTDMKGSSKLNMDMVLNTILEDADCDDESCVEEVKLI